MAAVRNRKREMVHGLVKMHLDRYKTTGAELVMGEAKFTGPRTIAVRLNDGGTRSLFAELLFLNLGTHAAIPPVPGLAESAPLTNEIRNFGAPDLILAGETIDVRARSANPPPLNDRGLLAGLRQMPGEEFPALTATDNDVPIVFCTHVNTVSKTSIRPKLLAKQVDSGEIDDLVAVTAQDGLQREEAEALHLFECDGGRYRKFLAAYWNFDERRSPVLEGLRQHRPNLVRRFRS